jgi:hypothetical protein
VVVDRPKIATFGRLLVAEAPATEASVLAIGSPAANAAAEVASSRVPVSSLSPPNRDDPADAVARLHAARPLGQGFGVPAA